MSRSTLRPESRTPVRISVLGSTGSIGTQTLDIARAFPDRIQVAVLTARSKSDRIVAQAREFRPECVVLTEEVAAKEAEAALAGTGIQVMAGTEALNAAAAWPDVDTVVTAMVGAAGLAPTVEAVRGGRRIALANKETMVVAGDLLRSLAHEYGAEIIPVDSEHSAIFQALAGNEVDAVDRLILTASGGPFLDRSEESLASVTPEEALTHPNWSMGAKITVDSASMMNKGLEVIEARWLFGIEGERIDVVVHPQSIIHSMVTFVDGSSLAQLGPPDMKVPIQVALSWPDRWSAPHSRVNWGTIQRFDFCPPDTARFPCLRLAFEALRTGGGAPAILNAANEVAVAAFLEGRLSFPGIPALIERILERPADVRAASIEDRLELDRETRVRAKELVRSMNHYSEPTRTAPPSTDD